MRTLLIAIALHALLFAGLAALPAGTLPSRSDRFEFRSGAAAGVRLVARAAPEPEMVVAAAAPRYADMAAPGEATVEALDVDLADDLAPPLAAASIAVEGGAHAPSPPLPADWVPHVSAARAMQFGRGHGSRHAGAGRGGSGGGTGTGFAAEAQVRVEPAPLEEPAPRVPVRIEARLRDYVAPAYPRSARERGLEGIVRVEADVAADGTVAGARVLESSGVRSFDEAAVKAVRGWRFEPATEDGAPVASTVPLPPIRFRLE